MQTIPIHQAKDQFSSMLQAVERGEEIIITRHGKRIAKITRETSELPDDQLVLKKRAAAIERLKAFQALVKSPVKGKSDWHTLRDLGRKY